MKMPLKINIEPSVLNDLKARKGGHSATMEQTELLAEDIRKFVAAMHYLSQPTGIFENVLE